MNVSWGTGVAMMSRGRFVECEKRQSSSGTEDVGEAVSVRGTGVGNP